MGMVGLECPNSHVWQFPVDCQLSVSLFLQGTGSDFFPWPSQGCKTVRADSVGPEVTCGNSVTFFRSKQVSRPAQIQGEGKQCPLLMGGAVILGRTLRKLYKCATTMLEWQLLQKKHTCIHTHTYTFNKRKECAYWDGRNL